MSSIKKRFSVGWMGGIALGLLCGMTTVLAGSVGVTFNTGDTLTATHMNDIATAVNDNNSRLGTAETDISNLKSSSGACAVGAGDEPGGMVRVGPLCVDKYLARADFTGCSADGTTSCGSAVAVSTSQNSPAVDMSWAQAARACANAGKRLLTPGEWMAAFISGAILETGTDSLEFVDSMLTLNSTNPATDGSSPGASSPAQGGYMGPRTAAGGKVQMVTNVDYDQVDADGSPNFLFFRCAR
jgi:hypothetical protein